MQTSYNQRFPVSQKASYKSGDNVDFVLSYPNKCIVGNSIRISGTLDVYNTGSVRLINQQVYYDNYCGIHSFFNNIVVSSQTKGVVENQSDYARWIKMRNTGTKVDSQIVSNARDLNELLCSDSSITNIYMNQSLPFSFIPDVCINNFIGTGVIPYSKVGDLTLSVRLSQPVECLFGSGMTNDVNFTISDLSCEYLTVAEQKNEQSIPMLISYSVKQVLNSMNSMINVKLPAIVNRVSASFLRVSEELALPYNNLEMERPTGIRKLYYSFNDQTNTFISFPVESIEDMIEHYLNSFFRTDDKNGCTLMKLNDNKFFGVGLDFEGQTNLVNNSFGVNIVSDITSGDPYYIFIYFRGVISLF